MASFHGPFNQQLTKLFTLIKTHLPNQPEIEKASKYMDDFRKINPRIAITMWKQFVAIPYSEYICAGNIEFFLTKDYSSDLSAIPGMTERDKQKIIDVINNGIRSPLRELYESHSEELSSLIVTLTNLSLNQP